MIEGVVLLIVGGLFGVMLCDDKLVTNHMWHWIRGKF